MKLNTINHTYKLAITTLSTILLGLTTYALVSPTTQDTSASTITNIAGSTSDYYVSLTSNDTISLPVDPDGTIHTVTDTITATSNTGSGYKVFVSMANSNTNGNRLYYNGDTTSSSYLSPTNTTSTDIPTNSWGVSVTTENPSDPTSSNVYTTMPLLGNELLVKNFTSDTPSTTIPITYAAKTDMSINAGTYKGEVIYSALANSPTNTILSTTTAYTTGGGTLTVSTPLMNSLSLDKATPTATVTIGGTTCTNPTIAINASTGIYEVSCTIPAKNAGSYDVVVEYTGAGLQDDTARSYTASSQLTYVTPTVSSVSPNNRYTTGTQTITMITNIAKDTPMTVTSAQVGTTTSNCTNPQITNSGDYRAITCTSPSLSAGTYAVSANVTINGSSTMNISKDSAITYVNPPTITSTSPAGARNASTTLTIVTDISSSATLSVSSVKIGTANCTSPSITTSGSYKAITCTTPTGLATGNYDVTANVTIDGASTSITKSQAFRYIATSFTNKLTTISQMQQMTSTICSQTTTPEKWETTVPEATLSDTRDSQQYKVRKLADGNCWMTENLRYGATTGGAARAYNSADAAKSNNMNTTNMANLTTSRICTTSSGCKTPGNVNMFSSSGDNYTMPYIMIYQANTAATYDGKTKYGVLYNYCAVTGGTVCNNRAMSTDAPGSVCPKGWKLPGMTYNPTGSGGDSSGATKAYDNVFNLYGVTNNDAGFNKIIASPFNFVRSGYAYNGSLGSRSSSGYGLYWSSTKYTNTNSAYFLFFYSSRVYQSSYGRYYGLSARCVSG